MQKGNIGVTTENIFPIIKKFLYSDHEIFLRELISNAVDATQKLKTLASVGDFKGDLGDLTINVSIDKDANTITISDHGIGLTEEEIDKYINQIAFSGATDFMEKYKDNATGIIGHFGLGFYSAFMVADKVELVTKSYKDDAESVKWTCNGSPEFEIEKADRTARGTDIILHIAEDCREFVDESKIRGLLTKYCSFLPVPIAFGKKKEWKDGKEVETAEDNIINNVEPLWTKKPSELKDEDYKKFYSHLYPMQDEPLFWIHLNVDYPFHLTGILYFPKIKSNIELSRNKIQLYCNQVFVTDSVEGIVPDFMTLLHGVIDSPDIPLNVSRSYLQSDSNVKKISTYITKKVADRLQSIFNNDRKQFEEKWDDLKVFINYGMLTDDEFYNRASKFALFKDTEGKYFTLDEYKTLIKDNQTDKDGTLVYLYATDRNDQYDYIDAANSKGYSVLFMDGQLDIPTVQMLEEKLEKSRFTRVDSDLTDNLIRKDDTTNDADAKTADIASTIFKTQLPHLDKVNFDVQVKAMGEGAQPIVITQSEYMRRMRDVAQFQPGMSFYGEMPGMYSLVVNSDHHLVRRIMEAEAKECDASVTPIREEIDKKLDEISELRKDYDKNKDAIAEGDKQLDELRKKKEEILKGFADGQSLVRQLIDIALLQNNMLKGQSLSTFIKRTIDMI
ncbi:MAG TPA: molecular chaperone HtpG [Candidatus Avibacteroides avistercoris]|uniref:Chaperone protein HtpG n=1 Tax=Candidatus Avibacteroides avistercoris TaxID=2840690 RepID=A0A9D2UHL4_9BACT|nr:molecular chaperone HtpG [Candidatus Avibacteroides avistercoris]